MQLWFSSPNVCATFLVMVIMLSIGIYLYTVNIKNFLGYSLAGLSSIWIIFLMLLLASTYSRGGYIAFFMAMAIVWCVAKRKSLIIFTAIGLLTILLVDNGGARLSSIGLVTSDLSILHRIYIWLGALAIIAKFPLTGVESAGVYYTAWYQPLSLDEYYQTMINDCLTLGTKHGILAVFIYLLMFSYFIYLAIIIGRNSSQYYQASIATLTGSLIGYFISGFFSTMYLQNQLIIYLYINIALLLLLLSYCVFKKRIKIKRKNVWIPLIFTSTICLSIFIAGSIVNYCFNYHNLTIDSYYTNEKNNKKFSFIFDKKPQQLFIHFYTKGDEVKQIRQVVRPLILKNYSVIAMEVDNGLSGLTSAQQQLISIIQRHPQAEIHLSGENEAGQISVLLACSQNLSIKIANIVVKDIEIEWPFHELSISENINNFQGNKLKVLLHNTNLQEQDLTKLPSGYTEVIKDPSITLLEVCSSKTHP